MRPVVYVDVLFFVNLFINYILLYLTAKTGRLKICRFRLAAGSALGALYSVFMFLPDLSMWYTTVAKLIFSMFIVAVSFNIHGVKLYFKALGIFYLVTLATGGGVLALFCFTGVGGDVSALIKNGVLYMNLPWTWLAAAVAVTYAGVRFTSRMLQSRITRSDMFMRINIFVGGLHASVDALVDTGNTLREPISDFPVIVAEYEQIKDILPSEMSGVFNINGEIDLEAVSRVSAEPSMMGRIRLIPFSSLGRERGMLVGFRPDKVSILENETDKTVDNVIVGICGRRLAGDSSYHALLSPELV